MSVGNIQETFRLELRRCSWKSLSSSEHSIDFTDKIQWPFVLQSRTFFEHRRHMRYSLLLQMDPNGLLATKLSEHVSNFWMFYLPRNLAASNSSPTVKPPSLSFRASYWYLLIVWRRLLTSTDLWRMFMMFCKGCLLLLAFLDISGVSSAQSLRYYQSPKGIEGIPMKRMPRWQMAESQLWRSHQEPHKCNSHVRKCQKGLQFETLFAVLVVFGKKSIHISFWNVHHHARTWQYQRYKPGSTTAVANSCSGRWGEYFQIATRDT